MEFDPLLRPDLYPGLVSEIDSLVFAEFEGSSSRRRDLENFGVVGIRAKRRAGTKSLLIAPYLFPILNR